MTVAKPPTPVLAEALTTAERIAAEIAAEPPELQRWMCFSLAGVGYAVNVLQLREVLPEARSERVPGAPAEVLGVLNLRGEIVTLLDLRRWLGAEPGRDGPVLVLELGGQSLALRVDAVGRLLKRMPEDLQPPVTDDARSPRLAELACGSSDDDGDALTLLDFTPLLGTRA